MDYRRPALRTHETVTAMRVAIAAMGIDDVGTIFNYDGRVMSW